MAQGKLRHYPYLELFARKPRAEWTSWAMKPPNSAGDAMTLGDAFF
jgi:hypothetical protein